MSAKYILHYLDSRQSLAQKALIAAKYNGIAIEQKKLKAVTESDVKASPVKTLPFLETDFGCVFASNAIARFIARNRRDTGLHGDGFQESVQVDSWTEFGARELEVPISVMVLCSKGEKGISITKQAFEQAKKDVQAALKKLETRLKDRTYLVGHSVTLADIVIICSLVDGFTSVLDVAFRKSFPKVQAWFDSLIKEPQFASVLGGVKLCEKEPTLKFA